MDMGQGELEKWFVVVQASEISERECLPNTRMKTNTKNKHTVYNERKTEKKRERKRSDQQECWNVANVQKGKWNSAVYHFAINQ